MALLSKIGKSADIFDSKTFQGWFLAWDAYKWSSGKTYEDMKAEMGSDDLFKEISLDELSNKVQEKHDSDEKITGYSA